MWHSPSKILPGLPKGAEQRLPFPTGSSSASFSFCSFLFYYRDIVPDLMFVGQLQQRIRELVPGHVPDSFWDISGHNETCPRTKSGQEVSYSQG